MIVTVWQVDYQLALKLVGYLKLETEFIPWNAGLAALQPIKVILSRTADYGIFKVKFKFYFLMFFVKYFFLVGIILSSFYDRF